MSEKPSECPKCGNTKLVLEAFDGEEICTSCGIVVNDKMETTMERDFPENDRGRSKASHHGYTIRQSELDQGSDISIHKAGTTNTVKSDPHMIRLVRLHKFTKSNTGKAKNLQKAMFALDGVAGRLKLGNQVKERAAYLYRKALDAR